MIVGERSVQPVKALMPDEEGIKALVLAGYHPVDASTSLYNYSQRLLVLYCMRTTGVETARTQMQALVSNPRCKMNLFFMRIFQLIELIM